MISNYNRFINENVYKDEFLRLYNLAPESLKELVDITKDVQQGADWHPEGVVYIHIRLVTNRLENTYHDKNLNLSGFFHDLGKIYVSKPNGRGGWSAHEHEGESIKIVKRYKKWIEEQGGAVDIVEYIVENHMRYKYLDEMRIQEQIRFMSDVYFPYVQKFSTADIGGTDLNCTPIDEHKEIKEKIKEHIKKEEENKEIKKKFNATMIMDKYPELRGEKLGNALALFKGSFDDFRNFVWNHSREEILQAFDDYMIGVKESVRDMMRPKTSDEINKAFGNVSLIKKFNIIIKQRSKELARIVMESEPKIKEKMDLVDKLFNDVVNNNEVIEKEKYHVGVGTSHIDYSSQVEFKNMGKINDARVGMWTVDFPIDKFVFYFMHRKNSGPESFVWYTDVEGTYDEVVNKMKSLGIKL